MKKPLPAIRACARARVLCKVSPPAVLVRRQPFISPVGQVCRMGCQLRITSREIGSSAVFFPGPFPRVCPVRVEILVRLDRDVLRYFWAHTIGSVVVVVVIYRDEGAGCVRVSFMPLPRYSSPC